MITRRTFLRTLPAALGLAALPAAAQSAPAIVGVGDSLTEDPGSYAHLLATELGRSLAEWADHGTILAEQALSWLAAPAGPTVTIAGYNDMRHLGGNPAVIAAWEGLLLGLCYARVRQGYPVYVGLCLRMTQTGYDNYPVPDNNHGSDAVVNLYHAATYRVAARLPGVVIIDTSAYDPYTMAGPDQVHPTTEGHTIIAAAFRAAWRELTWMPEVQAP